MAVLQKEIDMNMQEQKIYEYNRIYVYRVLKENIMKLILKPGEKITELNIKRTFNVSRSPIREAIVRLVDEELIDVFPQKGTYVSLLDPSLIEDSLFMRAAIEKEIMILLCSKDFDSENLLISLEYIFEKQKKIAANNLNKDSIMEFLDLNEQFHSEIFKNIGKINIWEKILKFGTHYVRFHILESISKTNVDFAIKQHTDIINAIKNKDYSIAMQLENNLLSNYRCKLKKVYDLYPQYFKYKV